MSRSDSQVRRAVLITRRGRSDTSLARSAARRNLAIWWRPVMSTAYLAGAVRRLRRLLHERRFDWIAVTSAAAAGPIAQALAQRARRKWPRPRIAAVGGATALRLRAFGLCVDLIGPGPGGRALARAILATSDPTSLRVLWPRAVQPHRDLSLTLRRADARVVDVAVYRRRASATGVSAEIAHALETRRLAAVCFTAPSTVRLVLGAMSAEGRARLRRTLVASVGPATTAELRRWKLPPDLEGSSGNVTALVRATLKSLTGHGAGLVQ